MAARLEAAQTLERILNRLASKEVLSANQGITVEEIMFLLEATKRKLQRDAMAMLDLRAPLMICGDLHGHFGDVVAMFHLFGWPSHETGKTYLFLGDYIDRGDRGIEVVCLMFALQLAFPRNVHVLRGNHECRDINEAYGFKTECENRFGEVADWLWQEFNDVFDWLPLCALVNGRILCMHGGIPRGLTSLDQLRNIQIPNDCSTEGFAADLLWSDPGDISGFQPSPRGMGHTFGVDELESFCQRMNIDVVFRAHQWFMQGYKIFRSGSRGRLVSLFGAPNYCGIHGNDAVSLFVDAELRCNLRVMKPYIPRRGQ